MKNDVRALLLLFFVFLICASCAENPTFSREDSTHNFFGKNKVTIAVVDSGLGGLSILADAAERSKNWKGFQKINFIFFNALFSNESGYNTLKNHQEKVCIFDSALGSLEKHYNPDLILIGCNTLSVLYDDTDFAERTTIPVRGIIDPGVDLTSDSLKAYPESKVILFATQTTVAQNTHKSQLLKKGFLPERIVYQACPELARYIEADYRGDDTEMLILAYVDEALQKVSNRRAPLLVSLNCTHYGYSLDLWKNAFHSLGIEPLAILNPNARMNDFLFEDRYQNRFKNTEISVQVVSMVEIGEKKVESLGSFLFPLSPQTADALRKYLWREDLFEWKTCLKNRD